MLRLFSPAKVNLFFRVLCKREDGYHEIASLFQAISLGDVVNVSLAREDCITCDDPKIPCDETNLVSKAIKVFREKTEYTHPVRVHLEKKIPMQAGLGGGSSNAATVLFALNMLSQLKIDEEILGQWAAAFSSDAPFFFSTGSAYCSGRGEQLKHLAPFNSDAQFWLAKPKEGLSTPLVYQNCDPKLFARRDPVLFLNRALKGQLELFNDLELSAFSLLPSLFHLKQDLLNLGFSQVTMTGSGTAFMCFGSVNAPSLCDISFFPVFFSHRKAGEEWYKFPIV